MDRYTRSSPKCLCSHIYSLHDLYCIHQYLWIHMSIYCHFTSLKARILDIYSVCRTKGMIKMIFRNAGKQSGQCKTIWKQSGWMKWMRSVFIKKQYSREWRVPVRSVQSMLSDSRILGRLMCLRVNRSDSSLWRRRTFDFMVETSFLFSKKDLRWAVNYNHLFKQMLSSNH